MYPQKHLFRIFTAAAIWSMSFGVAAQGNPGIRLLEPIGSEQYIPTEGNEGLGAFGYYMSLIYPYVVGMGAAVAVLMGLVGGIQIMLAGADSSKRSAGTQRLLISLGGLLMLLLSSTIMRALNPSFFK
jgi:hypothetical protein